ncbi:MAG: hypothetical protein V4469_00965 [Patescibacteria group bacterium]
MQADNDVKTFQNPDGNWGHDGGFSVELTPNAVREGLPTGVVLDGDFAHVANGRIRQSMGAIQLFSGDAPFYWRYGSIKAIRDSDNNLLWVNYDYR